MTLSHDIVMEMAQVEPTQMHVSSISPFVQNQAFSLTYQTTNPQLSLVFGRHSKAQQHTLQPA